MARIALVTGATRGIGAATAVALKAAGYKVIANYHGNDDNAQRFAAEHGIIISKFSVADFNACQEHVKQLETDHGPIDVLVNNAGITRDAMLHKMSHEQWEEVIDTNLSSMFNMCRAVVPGMRTRGFGRIVNIGSINGEAAMELGITNYSAAKAGVHGFTKALALESAIKGITVNTVAPGYINTDMLSGLAPDVMERLVARVPVGRLGRPEDIARCVVFLASDEAGYITGSSISANGGMHMY